MENKYVSLENLQQYNALLTGKMADDNAVTLDSAKEYADNIVAQKSQVQFYTWEEND